MLWIAPSEKDTANAALEKRLGDAGSNCELRGPSCEGQSNRHSSFVIRNLHRLSIHGVEKTDETGRLCRLNLAVHGVRLRQSVSGDAQVLYEHGKRFVISPVRAIASGDAQWLRAGR